MEMTYTGAMVMPSGFAVVDSDEMMYIDGGLKKWQKALAVAVIAVAGIALWTYVGTLIGAGLACKWAGVAVIRTITRVGAFNALASVMGFKAALASVLTIAGMGTTLATAIVAKYG